MTNTKKIIIGILIFIGAAVGFYINSQRDAIFKDALNYAQNIATEAIGTKVTIGAAEVASWSLSNFETSRLILRDIQIFDRDGELIASVDTARVAFKLFAIISDGASAVSNVALDGAHFNLTKRADTSWNVTDIQPSSGGDSSFGAFITLDNASLTATFDGSTVNVENITATANCADLNAIKASLTADALDSHIVAIGTIGAARQIINASVDSLDIPRVLALLPEGTVPDTVAINRGTASNITLNVYNREAALSFNGRADFAGGSVTVADTEIADIRGSANFSDAAVILDATATANGQTARANGTIRLDTDAPYFDIHARAANFTPAAVVPNLPLVGSTDFDAHIIGTVDDPKVEADISAARLAYENITATAVSTHLKYQRNAVYLSNIRANAFGGSVRGEAEIAAQNLAFNAHVRADNLNLDALRAVAGLDYPVSGTAFADLALNGNANDFATFKAFGEVSASNLTYDGFAVNGAKSSFLYADGALTLDYLNIALPNRGTFNAEGTIAANSSIDLDFYGSHIDLALARDFRSTIDISGLADFKASLHGSTENPTLSLNLSAVDSAQNGGERLRGAIFSQPYDSLQLTAHGNLDAVTVDTAYLEKNGQVTWTVIDGTVSLVGSRDVNLRLDTVHARLEDIARAISPDLALTGNVDNTFRVRGTLDNPRLVGYVEYNYGSFNEILITSMRGDYFLEGDLLRLQDFVFTTPMVDMVLNGTIDIKTYALDFVVEGRDIYLKRFQAKFPADYPVDGHGTFEGLISGTFNAPVFDGKLESKSFTLNGVELTNIRGHVTANARQVALDDFEFRQGDGKYSTQMLADTATRSLNGTVEVKNADISALAALAGKSTKILNGKLNSTITIGGTLDSPAGTLRGEISKGDVAGYDLHGVGVDINLADNVVYVQNFAGKQGAAGEFKVVGTASLSGPVDLTATARNLELAMFGAAAGLDAEFTGTTNLDAKITGRVANPTGEILLTATGGIKGSTFDLMRANITLANWIFNVREFVVRRAIGDKIYQASARGTVPIQALYIDSGENLAASDQLDLTVSLDDADLSLLPVVSNQIAWAVGNMGGSVKITGTASAPQVNGTIALKDGSVKVKALNNTIDHINIDTRFAGNNFGIENFTGNIGDGTFEVTGGFNFANYALSDYNFTFTADALDLKSAFFNGPLNAEFNLSEVKFRDRSIPRLAGHLDLDNCTISVPTLPDSDDPLPEVLLDVALNLGERVHFYSARLYNMFLTGTVKFEQSTTHPKTAGIISVKRGGTVTYIQTVFDIREGEAHFNQIDSFMPSLHFLADTSVGNAKITLGIDGPLGATKMSLTSNPEMTETEIAQLLTLRDAYGNATNQMTATDILAIGLQLSILGDIEDTVRRTVGLDRFTFSSGSGSAFENYSAEENRQTDDYEFNISVGKYISDKVMLKYTQGISGDKITRYGLQYDFNDNLGLTIEREDNEYIFSLEARYKF